MKYLFFDIECSNCFNGVGKMCEFGYVLTDENFHVMKSGDIPMSPGKGEGNRFHLKGRKNEKDLELAYEYGYYLEQPEFPKFHKQIKSLVEDPDTICFAYSMDNDIPHLYHACTRYKLQPFNYVCYDVQKLVAAYLEKKGQMSLRNACLKIVGPNSVVRLQEHLSRDDAEMERLIFEAICILTKTKDSLRPVISSSTRGVTFVGSYQFTFKAENATKVTYRIGEDETVVNNPSGNINVNITDSCDLTIVAENANFSITRSFKFTKVELIPGYFNVVNLRSAIFTDYEVYLWGWGGRFGNGLWSKDYTVQDGIMLVDVTGITGFLIGLFQKDYTVTVLDDWDNNIVRQSGDIKGATLTQGFYDASSL